MDKKVVFSPVLEKRSYQPCRVVMNCGDGRRLFHDDKEDAVISHVVSLGARAFLADFIEAEKGVSNEDDDVNDDDDTKKDTDVDDESDLDA